MRLIKGPKIAEIRDKARELILEAALKPLAGHEKRRDVVDHLVKFIDEALVFGPGPVGRLAEWFDGRLARLLLEPLVQEVFERLERAGELP